MDENLFKKVENRTKVNKNTILNLAAKLQNGNMKDNVPNNIDSSF